MNPSKELVEIFWANVFKTEGCWLWLGTLDRPQGYGIFKGHRAHRFAWELENGPIPEGRFICHHCDNPPCVNAAHLFVGTNADNMKDCWNKERFPHIGQSRKTHCIYGHPLTPGQFYVTKLGHRRCRICHDRMSRASLIKRRERRKHANG